RGHESPGARGALSPSPRISNCFWYWVVLRGLYCPSLRRRSANQEFGRHYFALAKEPVALIVAGVQRFENTVCRVLAHLKHRLTNRREPRRDKRRRWNIIEANHGAIVRDPQAGFE